MYNKKAQQQERLLMHLVKSRSHINVNGIIIGKAIRYNIIIPKIDQNLQQPLCFLLLPADYIPGHPKIFKGLK